MEERPASLARVVAWWRAVPSVVANALLAAVVLAVTLTEIRLGDERQGAGGTLLLVAMSVAITFRRRWPMAVWLVSGVLAATYGIGAYSDPTPPYAPLIAVYTVAAHTSARRAAWAGVVRGSPPSSSATVWPPSGSTPSSH